MIKFNMHKPTDVSDFGFAGVTGENLITEKEFFIEGLTDSSMTFSIHLRFADGSVNSVIPESAEFSQEGVSIFWKIRKNDIFMHGYFELQIEGTKPDETVFQTEIIRLYADESIPIEDKSYENPNSETLALRNEIYQLLQTISEQEEKIAENTQIILESDLSQKQDLLFFDTKPTTNSDNLVTSGAIATALAKKYDSSNITSGTGTLTLATSADVISASEYEYSKVGKQVMVMGKITFSAGNISGGYFALTGLPTTIKTDTMSSGIRVLAQSSKANNFAVWVQSTMISVQHLTDPYAVSQGEILRFSLTYLTT